MTCACIEREPAVSGSNTGTALGLSKVVVRGVFASVNLDCDRLRWVVVAARGLAHRILHELLVMRGIVQGEAVEGGRVDLFVRKCLLNDFCGAEGIASCGVHVVAKVC